MVSRKEGQTNYDFVKDFYVKKVRFWGCWTHRNALYISISVVLADYHKIQNLIKKLCQNDSQNDLKIETLVFRGILWEVFWSIQLSINFGSTQNPWKIWKLMPLGGQVEFGGEPDLSRGGDLQDDWIPEVRGTRGSLRQEPHSLMTPVGSADISNRILELLIKSGVILFD